MKTMRGREYRDIVIVGGGIAGYTAARTLTGTDSDPKLSVLLIGGEDRVPYKRTKLSRHIASGFERNEFALPELTPGEPVNAELILGERVTRIDPSRRSVTLESGKTVSYGKLLLTTGSTPALPDIQTAASDRIHTFRTASDLERLRNLLGGVQEVLVVGMGVQGAETAEQLSLLGKHVMFLGKDPMIMGRHLNAAAAGMLAELYTRHGVELMFSRTVESVREIGNSVVTTIRNAGHITSDLVIFCTGVFPNTLLARNAGLRVNRGILVDEHLAASEPDIYAAGDCAEHPGGLITGLWHAAELQGEIAGLAMMGRPVTYNQPPFRMKCEVYGEYYFSMQKPAAADYGSFTLVEDRPNYRKRGRVYRCFYMKNGMLHGAVMVNDGNRARLYEQAVRERWDAARIDSALFP